MRPAAIAQSALSAPLNAILASEANVRILRILSVCGEMSVGELTRATELSGPGLRKALAGLEDTAIVELSGQSKTRRARLRRVHPLAKPIRALFLAEAKRAESLWRELAELARESNAVAAWVEGAVALGTDTTVDAVDLRVLAGADEIDTVMDALERGIETIERRWGVMVQLLPTTRADLAVRHPRRALQTAKPILGPPPTAFLPTSPRPAKRKQHADQDARAKAIGEAIANLIRKDPGLIDRTRDQLELARPENKDLREWLRILRTSSPAQIRTLLTDEGERATRLRQSLPFLRSLTDRERRILSEAVDG